MFKIRPISTQNTWACPAEAGRAVRCKSSRLLPRWCGLYTTIPHAVRPLKIVIPISLSETPKLILTKERKCGRVYNKLKQLYIYIR